MIMVYCFLKYNTVKGLNHKRKERSIMKNTVNVQLAGKSYNLTSDDNPEYTIKLSNELNKRMDIIKGASGNLSALDAALLCAMDLLDELTKANSNIENIRMQIKDYVDDAGQARLKADESQKELRVLRAKVAELQTELKKRTTVIRYDNEKVENAREMLSKEINAAIHSPVHPAGQANHAAQANQPAQQNRPDRPNQQSFFNRPAGTQDNK